MNFSKVKTLVLFARVTDKLSYYDDWLDAFSGYKGFDATCLNIANERNIALLDKTIGDFEFIALLHSTNGGGVSYLKPYKNILAKRKGTLLAFVGNEVNLPQVSIRDKIDFIRDIEAEFIGTQLPLEAGQWLYGECEKSRVVPLPHALNPDVFKPVIPEEDRKIDFGVRSNRYLPHIGDDDRERLFSFFRDNTFSPPLSVDISTTSRYDRGGWADFLTRCRGTLSNEAGTYYLERDDKTVREIQKFIEERAASRNRRIIADNLHLPALWHILPRRAREWAKKILKPFGIISKRESYYSVGFGEIFERFFKGYKKPPFYSKAISSRHFDAIGTKTCQVMFEGSFNGILKADEHYIALKGDFSNIDDVIRRFRDTSYRKAMTDRSYDYVMEEHTYAHRMKAVTGYIKNNSPREYAVL